MIFDGGPWPLVFLYCLRLVARTDTRVADLHLPQRLADRVSAALPLASNWIPQLFLFNFRRMRRVGASHNTGRKKARKKQREKQGGAIDSD